MDGHVRRASVARIVLVAVLAAIAIAGAGSPGIAAGVAVPAAASSQAAPALPRWTGGIDLYRRGVFATQQTWLWCTAADVQIIRNIADHQRDHSRASQQRYFDWMRAHNRYDIPLRDGVDPAGWAAGLRHFVDRRYRLVASDSFSAALRSAVTNLRRTNLPVGITVAHGNHAWILTGFTATADPAKTSRFTVTSVRVVGPLWGLQSRTYGYDMRPDTKLTPAQLKGFFTRWHYAGVRMAWEGRWVSVQPIPATRSGTGAASVGSSASPAPAPTQAVASASAVSAPPSDSPSPSGSPSVSPSPVEARPSPSPVVVAAVPAGRSAESSSGPPAAADAPATGPATAQAPVLATTFLVLLAVALVTGSVVARRGRDRTR